MSRLKPIITITLILLFSYSIAAAEIDLLGLTLDVKESGIDLDNVNITVEIYDAATGGNLIYNSSSGFENNVSNGKVDIILGDDTSGYELNLTYGTTYYMEITINGTEMDFNGNERQKFQSTVGNITETRLNLTGTLSVHSLEPAANATFDLGSGSNFFRNLFLETLNIIKPLNTSQIEDVYLFNTGDTATGDYTFDSPTLHIDSGNNFVGIGTTTPANALNVIGSGNFSGALWIGGTQITADSNVSGGGTTNYLVKFLDTATIGNSLIYDDGTLVGIDTISPQGKLEITNSTTLNVPWLNVTDGGNGIKFVIDTAGRIGIAKYPDSTSILDVSGNITGSDSLILDYIFANSLDSTRINNATITNDLRVLGNSYLGTLIFDSNGTFPDSILTDFIFPEASSFTTIENATINQDLHILGTLYGGSPLLISGSANLSGNLTLVDDSVLADYIYSHTLASTIINNLSVTNDVFASGNISTPDSLILDYIYAKALASTLINNLSVTNDVFVTGNLSSADSINSDYLFPKSASFTRIDNVTIAQDLRVLGSSYLGSFIIKDDLSVGQTNITNTFTGIGAINPLFLLHLNLSDSANTTFTELLALEKTTTGVPADGLGAAIMFRAEDDAREMENISMISGILEDVSNGTERGALVFYTGYGDVNGLISNLSSAEKVRIDAQGRVGIGTSAPTHTLNVAGDANLTSDLNVEGLCVAEDSLITLASGEKKQIKDIKEGEEVLSLNEETGKLVSTKVNSLLDMGFKQIYELTTSSGKSVNTTATHPYLAKIESKEKCSEYADNVWNKNNPESYNQKDYCLRWVSVKDLKEGNEIATQDKEETRDRTESVQRIWLTSLP